MAEHVQVRAVRNRTVVIPQDVEDLFLAGVGAFYVSIQGCQLLGGIQTGVAQQRGELVDGFVVGGDAFFDETAEAFPEFGVVFGLDLSGGPVIVTVGGWLTI